jgi:uncharacterized membrane protein
MSICFRCTDETNQKLNEEAQKMGISKNHLLELIVLDYLKNSDRKMSLFAKGTSSLEPKFIEKFILETNETLMDIMDRLNNLPVIYGISRSEKAFTEFRRETLDQLIRLTELLEAMMKEMKKDREKPQERKQQTHGKA